MPAHSHHCHAHDCDAKTPPAMFMCRTHWYLVPKAMRDAIWSTYRRGQEVDKNPSDDYLRAADAAVRAVATKEGKVIEKTGYADVLAARERLRARGTLEAAQ